ncbi:PASTA domain-containing protein [Deinococcus cellulosilyticus]|uniref:PASTA domain-containing protein n=1 Tax=Deinococcus cellulosilyticus (strain DSM 18568 / NBRC 106333 / KACC 11606 / 5516J-15) TaxID=1223518 RepID=A0A511N4N3_DEIC1|nr:PASTA domain-containing protein [Deinococcus cellulosilyticus]GEM47351.1 PASTA domain-containing protein [Deinococcus cellulosilyticus NBRC 106333 = KACC 11606]
MGRIDGKYEIVQELSKETHSTLYEATGPGGELVRVDWFTIVDPSTRTLFLKYRTALKGSESPLLQDVVSKPGAYYTVWKTTEVDPIENFLQAHVKDAAAVEALITLVQVLTEQGFAAQDADIGLLDGKPVLRGLKFVERPIEEVQRLNAEFLKPLQSSKVRATKPRKPKPVRPRLTIWGWLPGLLFLTLTGYVMSKATQSYLNPPIFTVPDVTGKSITQAATAMVDAGFRVAVVDGEEPGIAIGTVIEQDHKGGTSLNVNRLVTLTVNNPPPLSVPKITDMTVGEATRTLQEVGLKVGAVTTSPPNDLTLPKGSIIAQDPEPGTQVGKGSTINILISGGKKVKETFLPTLKGMTFDEAKAEVEKAGLVLNKVQQITSELPEGTVIRQTPDEYKKVPVGSPVTIYISRAPIVAPPSRDNGQTRVGPIPQPAQEPTGGTTDPGETTGGTTDPGETTGGTTDPGGTGTETPDPGTQTPETPETTLKKFQYVFPSDLGPGVAELRVQDETGEKSIVKIPDAAGTSADIEVNVTGNAVFNLYLDGQLVSSFER